jgi:hypothetical protein
LIICSVMMSATDFFMMTSPFSLDLESPETLGCPCCQRFF